MKILYFHFHGTTGLHPFHKIFKFGANFVYPDLFTDEISLGFIPLEEAPGGVQNFAPLFNEIDENNCFYFQWSGALGKKVWDKAANFFQAEVMALLSEEETNHIVILGHSHGGNIARIIAQNFMNDEYHNVIFHIISVATPLCGSPPLNMPENVKTWLHFYNNKDTTAELGSRIMQTNFFSPIKKKIEDVYDGTEEPLINEYDETEEQPADKFHWESFLLTEVNSDPHNNAMREPLSNEICDTVLPILGKMITEKENTIEEETKALNINFT